MAWKQAKKPIRIISTGLPRPGLARSAHRLQYLWSKSTAALNSLTTIDHAASWSKSSAALNSLTTIDHTASLWEVLGIYVYTCFNERWEKEERKKQAKANKQTRQSNTAHPRLTFPRKNAPQVGFEPTPLYSPDRALYQCSWATEAAQLAGPKHVHVYTYILYMLAQPINYAVRMRLIIGRAGASPPSRTNSMIFLYIYIYIYIFIYIRSTVRRALNLLRASFSPIFQYFSAVNVTRVSFSTCSTSAMDSSIFPSLPPRMRTTRKKRMACETRILRPWRESSQQGEARLWAQTCV